MLAGFADLLSSRSTAMQVHARSSYRADEIVWNARFQSMFLPADARAWHAGRRSGVGLSVTVRHHLDVFTSARNYSPVAAGVDPDLTAPMGPIEPVLERVDSILLTPIELTDEEFSQLVDFVRNGLLDQRAKPENLRKLIPRSVPSGFSVLRFE